MAELHAIPTSTADQKLKSFADRLGRLMDDRDALNDDIKAVKAEAKADGFNPRALTRFVALSRDLSKKAKAEEELNDTLLYARTLGEPLDVATGE